jgi:hypothetical protein
MAAFEQLLDRQFSLVLKPPTPLQMHMKTHWQANPTGTTATQKLSPQLWLASQQASPTMGIDASIVTRI